MFKNLEKDCTSNDGLNESVFSINKLLLEIHGSPLKKETIEAIRTVKDSILRYESILDIPVTKEIISMVSTSRQLYMDHLEQKQKEEEKAKEEATLNVNKNESEKGFAQEQNIELQNIESALAQI